MQSRKMYNGDCMANSAVSNTGPILHLREINLMKALDFFSKILIPEEVAKEITKKKVSIPKKIKILKINSNFKDAVKVLTNQNNLDLGEAEAIALCLQEKTAYFLTDDLDARKIAASYFVETHGSVGIILRALREKIIDKKIAVEKLKELKAKSSLFITSDLIKQAISAINEFKEK